MKCKHAFKVERWCNKFHANKSFIEGSWLLLPGDAVSSRNYKNKTNFNPKPRFFYQIRIHDDFELKTAVILTTELKLNRTSEHSTHHYFYLSAKCWSYFQVSVTCLSLFVLFVGGLMLLLVLSRWRTTSSWFPSHAMTQSTATCLHAGNFTTTINSSTIRTFTTSCKRPVGNNTVICGKFVQIPRAILPNSGLTTANLSPRRPKC